MKMERYIGKLKEVVIKEKSINKNLSWFLHIYHGLGDMKVYFSHNFQNFAKLFLQKRLDQSHLLIFRDFQNQEFGYLEDLLHYIYEGIRSLCLFQEHEMGFDPFF